MELRGWKTWAAYWSGWTLLGAYMATQGVFYHGTLAKALLANLIHYELWGVLTLFIVPFARRYPLEPRFRVLALHAAAAVGAALVDVLVGDFICYQWLNGHHLTQEQAFREAFATTFHLSFLTYWAVIGVQAFLDLSRRFRARELQASRLEARLAQAQLQALKMQLQPHFLFNTLNAITALMHSDLTTANRMLTRLSHFLRVTLDQRGEQEITLREELAFIRGYLEIEELRFEARLRVELSVPGELLGARVPSFVLQPLVENALKHGISPSLDGGRVAIRARREEPMLVLEVEDDGAGLAEHQGGGGIGTSNIRLRLEQLYGADQSFTLTGSPGKGALARIEIPFVMHQDDEAIA